MTSKPEPTTYDVTGITRLDGEFVPIAANVDSLVKAEVSADYYSQQTHDFRAVQVKDARTGQVVATYVNARRQP